jgi:transcription-repair coupling factor (superfamily II helicase)
MAFHLYFARKWVALSRTVSSSTKPLTCEVEADAAQYIPAIHQIPCYMCATMQRLLEQLADHPGFLRINEELLRGGPSRAEGLWGASAPLLVAALARKHGGAYFCVLPTVEQAETFFEDLQQFLPDQSDYFPAWETLKDEDIPDAEILSERLGVLQWLYDREAAPADGRAGRVIVAPVQAVLQPVPSPRLLKDHTLTLEQGDYLPIEDATAWLADRGFQAARRVEVPGEFCRRGGILDIYPYASDRPVRVEYFGDDIESIRHFDTDTQSSEAETPRVDIAAIPRHILEEDSERSSDLEVWHTVFDHLSGDCRLVIKEPVEVFSHKHLPASLLGAEAAQTCHEALKRASRSVPTLSLASMPGVFGGRQVTFHVHSIERFGADLATSLGELTLIASERKRAIVCCANQGEKDRLLELLADSPALNNESFEIQICRINHGFDWTDLSVSLLTHHEIFQRYRQRRIAPRYRHTKVVDSFYDLSPGDLVVHAVQGIGVFRGMEVLDKGPDRQECLKLEYAEGSLLYVPAARVELVQKYIGPSEHRPPLSKLGTKGWLKRKEKTEEAVRDLAAELLRLQAVREAKRGIAHGPDTDWQREFEAAFPYMETEDQLRVAVEMKKDMEAKRPMDRLICGDVGYGKTEVAMRGAFKAVMGGHQVAVLVPTTVLAAQHTQTFQERMAAYPVKVRMLSRFLTRGEQAKVIEGLAHGDVDIVIGTHRLVQTDVYMKNLGLVIIDEEQRFGVAHKERLKQLRATVDVLTLTATPIPRTLHMSLLGIRDIATLDTPPRDRLAIHTRLVRYNPDRIRQAILHEMSRDGQIFFVHNRVQSIDAMAATLRQLIPEARIEIGHGQMPEGGLKSVMNKFIAHEADVLVCTTIIESGLDIPNANTIIINNANMFGLAELHQLRGRVGRYKHRAYAHMVVPVDRPITPIAEKRLKAIEEFCELGAGFRIAMRDLELRGAGNILGPEQSGHIAAVGYDMYCKLLEQAVRAMKQLPEERETAEVSVSIGLEALLPEDYVSDVTQRIELYRKLQRATHDSDANAIGEELRDRFGDPPQSALNLLNEARFRIMAMQLDVTSIVFREDMVTIRAGQCVELLPHLTTTGLTVRQVDANTLYLWPESATIKSEELLDSLTVLFANALQSPIKETESP